MANQEERIFKKIYTDFDKRLDQELDEEKAERRRQLLLQAPNFKLLNMMVENEKYSQELAAKLKDGGLYYLRSREEENVEKYMGIFRRTLQSHPSVREELFKQAGFLGCMAYKRDIPLLGRLCGEAVLSGLRLLKQEDQELIEQGYLQFKNVTNTALRSRNEEDFRELVNALDRYWKDNRISVTPGLLGLLSGLLFVAADRRQTNALVTVCSLSRNVLRRSSEEPVVRQQFVMEWSNTAAQIAQRDWKEETGLLLTDLCLCLGSVRDVALIKKVMADISIHMQMQSKWDNFEIAFRLYYPCQLFSLALLQWGMRRYRHALQSENVVEAEAEIRESGILDQVEQKMNVLGEKEEALELIRFVLRNVRDMAAACARLRMKDEWEIFVSWQREWLSAVPDNSRRKERVRLFLQMAAEYWRNTRPSRSSKQWEFMTEVVTPSLLSDQHMELIKEIS